MSRKYLKNQTWLPYAASIAGQKHEQSGSEDGFFTAVRALKKHTVSCVSVCDGISDRRAAHSPIGARVFSRAAAEFFMPRFDMIWNAPEQDLNNITVEYRQEVLRMLDRWVQSLSEEEGGREYPPVLRENPHTHEKNIIINSNIQLYATTLQTALVSSDGRLIFLAIGDGSCQLQVGREMVPLWQTEPGGRATAHITFPSIGDVLCNLRWQRLWLPPQTSGVYLMTDGGKFPGGLYNGSTLQAEAALKQAASLLAGQANPQGNRQLRELLQRLRSDKNNDQFDDITLAALVYPCPDTHSLSVPAAALLESWRLYQRSQRPPAKD